MHEGSQDTARENVQNLDSSELRRSLTVLGEVWSKLNPKDNKDHQQEANEILKVSQMVVTLADKIYLIFPLAFSLWLFYRFISFKHLSVEISGDHL